MNYKQRQIRGDCPARTVCPIWPAWNGYKHIKDTRGSLAPPHSCSPLRINIIGLARMLLSAARSTDVHPSVRVTQTHINIIFCKHFLCGCVFGDWKGEGRATSSGSLSAAWSTAQGTSSINCTLLCCKLAAGVDLFLCAFCYGYELRDISSPFILCGALELL